MHSFPKSEACYFPLTQLKRRAINWSSVRICSSRGCPKKDRKQADITRPICFPNMRANKMTEERVRINSFSLKKKPWNEASSVPPFSLSLPCAENLFPAHLAGIFTVIREHSGLSPRSTTRLGNSHRISQRPWAYFGRQKPSPSCSVPSRDSVSLPLPPSLSLSVSLSGTN